MGVNKFYFFSLLFKYILYINCFVLFTFFCILEINTINHLNFHEKHAVDLPKHEENGKLIGAPVKLQ